MLFDFIKAENSPLKNFEGFIANLNAIENLSDTDSIEVVLHARLATERFINAILEINGIEIPDDMEERKKLKLECTANKLKFIFEKGFIDKNQFTYLNAIRRAGNTVVNQAINDNEDVNAKKVIEFLYEAIKTFVDKNKEI